MRTEVQEDEIKTGLREDEQKQFEAICKALEQYAGPLAASVREHFPTLDSHEQATAVHDVFIELARKAKQGTFKTDGSLKSLLFQMARCNAADQLRAKYRWQKRKSTDHFTIEEPDGQGSEGLSDDEVASLVARKLSNAPGIATAWRVVTQEWTPADQAAAHEIIRQFKMWITTLPCVQRKVAQLMAAHFGDVTDEEICHEIAKTGEPSPLGSVKSARREIRDKFESLMKNQERAKTP